jgi:hypothetical protein
MKKIAVLISLIAIGFTSNSQTSATFVANKKRINTHAHEQVFPGDWGKVAAKIVMTGTKVVISDTETKAYTLGKPLDMDEQEGHTILAWYTLDKYGKLGTILFIINHDDETFQVTTISDKKSTTYSCDYKKAEREMERISQ